MLGTLTSAEMENLLAKEVIGRVGCTDGKRVYIVPISYAYDGTHIYCHSSEGLKLRIMRNHRNVCFEVESFQNMGNWQSLVIQGYFEELKDNGLRNYGLQKLHDRVLPLVTSETTHLSPDWPFQPAEFSNISGITFRIHPMEKYGRFERSDASTQSPRH